MAVGLDDRSGLVVGDAPKAIEPEESCEQMRKQAPEKVKRILSQPGNVNFLEIACSLLAVELDPPIRAWIGERVSEKIEEALSAGQFEELEGAKELMEVVGLEYITFSNGLISRLNEQLPRIT